MNNGEKEYASLQADDFAKLSFEIGDQFGHSSLHCIAFEGMLRQIERLTAELAATSKGYQSAVQRANDAIIERDQLKSCERSMREALETTADNIRSLGPAGALSHVYSNYEGWLKLVEIALGVRDPDGNLAGPDFGDGPEFEGWAERSGQPLEGEPEDELCDDCPPDDYPTDKTRCLPCPRRKQGVIHE